MHLSNPAGAFVKLLFEKKTSKEKHLLWDYISPRLSSVGAVHLYLLSRGTRSVCGSNAEDRGGRRNSITTMSGQRDAGQAGSEQQQHARAVCWKALQNLLTPAPLWSTQHSSTTHTCSHTRATHTHTPPLERSYRDALMYCECLQYPVDI